MLIFKKTSTLAVRHVFHPEAFGTAAEALVKDGVRSLSETVVHDGARALGHVAEEAGGKLLGDWVKKLTERVRDHFTDHSEALTEALSQANEKAWKSIEVALGGKGFKDRFASETDKGLREKIQSFLDTATFPAENPDFLAACLFDLRMARERHHLVADCPFDPASLAEEVGPFAHYDDPEAIFAAECAAVTEVARDLQRLGYRNLGRLLALTPTGGQPLLAMAVQFYFRRAITDNPKLFQEMTWVKLIAIDRRLQEGFEFVTLLLGSQGDHIELVLKGQAVHTARLTRIEDRVVELSEKLLHRLDEPQGPRGVSVSGDEEERWLRMRREEYRALPQDVRARHPDLGLALSLVESAAGKHLESFEQARDVAESAVDPASKARAYHCAFHAKLKLRSWDEALALLQQAMAADPSFSLWPRNKYRVERILGVGGYGVAFLCWNNYKLRRVVLKSFHTAGMHRSAATVFHEAHALDRLGHPGIIRLFDCGYGDEAAQRYPYLELEEFADSLSLEEYIQTHGKLSPEDLWPIAFQTAEALQTAHATGVWHRDLKPGNLLVRKTAKGWEVKVIDFGLSLRRTSVATSQACSMSQNRFLVGSPVGYTEEYAAPEQLDPARSKEVGPHSDVFGFGRTCLYALFQSTKPRAKAIRSLPEPWPDLLDDCCDDNIDPRKDFTIVLTALASPGPGSVVVPPPPPPPPPPGKLATPKVVPASKWAGRRAKAGDVKGVLVKDQKIRFCWCPPGSFKMGSPETEIGRFDDENQVDVTLTHGFWMQQTQVTQGLWEAVMESKLYWSIESIDTMRGGPRVFADPMNSDFDWRNYSTSHLPVFNASHDEAEAFCSKITELLRAEEQLPSEMRIDLPSEAQWEYAARAGTTTRFPFGDDESKLGEYAWFDENSGDRPHAVASRKPNAWRLHDMLGNVCEWCADEYVDKLPGGVDPCPSGALNRVFRGGSWNEHSRACRPAQRSRFLRFHQRFPRGFRLAVVQK